MSDTKKLLVFQHLAVEHPGIFRDFFNADGFEWDIVELDKGEPIPELSDYDALWVMGGPMDVWEEVQYPWLVKEKLAIRRAVLELNMPFVGICLGHQLLADALGGEVVPGLQPEVGVMYVQLSKAGQQNPVLKDLPKLLLCLQWHSAAVYKPPAGLDILASSEACQIQALGNQRAVFSSQFHVEITESTVTEWSKIPAYREALEKTLGKGAIGAFAQQVEDNIQLFNDNARIMYLNWRKQAFGM